MAKRDLDEWDREIEADFRRKVAATRARGKGKKRKPFATVPLDCAKEMARECRSPAFAVCVHLLYLSWKPGSGPVEPRGLPPQQQRPGVAEARSRRASSGRPPSRPEPAGDYPAPTAVVLNMHLLVAGWGGRTCTYLSQVPAPTCRTCATLSSLSFLLTALL
jgi:hypothetical protein